MSKTWSQYVAEAEQYQFYKQRCEQLEAARATLLRWCDEDAGSVKGHISHVDIRYVLASGGDQ